MNGPKLGKRPAQLDRRTVRLSSILRALPPLPYEFDVDKSLGGFPADETYSNLQYGDCAIASRAHMTLRFEKREQGILIPITTDEVVAQYFKETGGPDIGIVMLDSLNRWRKEGWKAGGKEHDIYAFAGLTWQDHTEVQAAIYLLNGAYTGILLPTSASTQFGQGKTWEVVPDSAGGGRGTWGGHAVYIKGYNATGPVCVTWGKLQQLTWAFWDKYTDECYGIVDNANRWDPDSPLDVEKLAALLAEITSTPIPAPVPPEPIPVPPTPPAPKPGCCKTGRAIVKAMLRSRIVTFKR